MSGGAHGRMIGEPCAVQLTDAVGTTPDAEPLRSDESTDDDVTSDRLMKDRETVQSFPENEARRNCESEIN